MASCKWVFVVLSSAARIRSIFQVKPYKLSSDTLRRKVNLSHTDLKKMPPGSVRQKSYEGESRRTVDDVHP